MAHQPSKNAPSLRELEILRAMIQTRKTLAAGAQLGISQSAVSRSLSSLEQKVGKVLFRHDAGRLIPTADAFTLNSDAAPIFDTMDRLRHWPEGGAPEKILRIGVSSTLADYLVADMVAKFREQEANVNVMVDIGPSAWVIATVAEGAVDIGIAEVSAAHPGVRIEYFREGCIHAVMPRDHPLAGEGPVGPDDLACYPLILLARRFASRAQLDSAFMARGIVPQIAAETVTTGFSAELVRRYQGIALINPFPLTLRDISDFCARPFEPRILHRTALLFKVSGGIEPTARRFADMVKAEQRPDGFTLALN